MSIPMTWPEWLARGPPESPGSSGASVWISPVSCSEPPVTSSLATIELSRASMAPVETLGVPPRVRDPTRLRRFQWRYGPEENDGGSSESPFGWKGVSRLVGYGGGVRSPWPASRPIPVGPWPQGLTDTPSLVMATSPSGRWCFAKGHRAHWRQGSRAPTTTMPGVRQSPAPRGAALNAGDIRSCIHV